MEDADDDLRRFEAQGALPLGPATRSGFVPNDGAQIWFAVYGSGTPVILLHGGFGNGENWGYQVPALVARGYSAVLIDSRGHGRSTRDMRPFSYELMATDVLAVMDALAVGRAAFVGWSDGATIALILARTAPGRVDRVFFFGGNMDPGGVRQPRAGAVIGRMFGRHVADYRRLSVTPEAFDDFAAALTRMMQTEPNYTPADLADISVPVTIVWSEHDEFIRREHAEYLARTIPQAHLLVLPDVSHFAPLQRPAGFNDAMLTCLR